MDTLPPTADRALYEADEHAWIARQVEALRSGRLHRLDRDTLADYLTDLTKRDQRELKSRFVVLLQHLLKIRMQPERLTRSWVLTLLHQQAELKDILETSPSLAAGAEAVLEAAYPTAARFAATETGLPPAVFPRVSPWTVPEALSFQPPEPPSRRWRRRR